jgi:hypothetical protein
METLDMADVAPGMAQTYVRIASAVTVIFTPLAALSYFATREGAEAYAIPTARAWARPARALLDPLLSFGSADRVYATYTLLLALVLPALPLAAWTVRRARAAVAGPGERRASLVVASAWTLFAVGLAVASLALQVDPSSAGGSSVVNVAYLGAMLPGLLIALLSSLVLGIMLLYAGFVPRWTAIVILLALPIWFLGSFVLGHNSLGILPQLIAWTFALTATLEQQERAVGGTPPGGRLGLRRQRARARTTPTGQP